MEFAMFRNALRLAFLLSCVLFALLVSCTPVLAQFDAASVLGYVRDSSGAAVPNSRLSLTNVSTKIVRTGASDASGRYEFVSVPIGQYTVSGEAAGFERTETSAFALTVNARQRIDLTLPVGNATTTVDVSAAPTLLETETSSRGQVIGEHEIQNLPLNGRSYADLVLLVPGVSRSVIENQTAASREASFNVNGQRSAFNNFLLDGLDNNNYGTSNQGFANENIPPSPECRRRIPRGDRQLQRRVWPLFRRCHQHATTRSGTNAFHGRAWEYQPQHRSQRARPVRPGGWRQAYA